MHNKKIIKISQLSIKNKSTNSYFNSKFRIKKINTIYNKNLMKKTLKKK